MKRLKLPPYFRELLIVLVFVALTVLMTWPWIGHLRDGVSDPGDPYLNSWILWWDYHQTFSDPLHLFNANIFFPYRYTLAFSENNYGIALLFFPLFALGLRPLTIHSLATLLGFAFSGYGMFRLARTLGGSEGVGWIAGIVFGFIPYRFGQLPHLNYLFAGWIPILLEALLLFARNSSRRHGMWLGFAFFMNALTCIHWLILTLIPLGFSAAFMLIRQSGWRKLLLWRRALAPLALACFALIPFLLPYARVARLYGFVRGAGELRVFSAEPVHWLIADGRNRLWSGLNARTATGERALFPGLAPILLALAAFFFVKPESENTDRPLTNPRLKRYLVFLDLSFVICALLGFVAAGFEASQNKPWFPATLYFADPALFFSISVAALVTRCFIAYPLVFHRARHNSLVETIAESRRSDAFWLGLIWAFTGFFGSLGLNFFFHSFLFRYVPFFGSIRVPARWATICYVGLALLAGLGARRLVQLLARHRPKLRGPTVYILITVAILFEQRAAPLRLFRGDASPNELTLRLKQTKMAGGIVELPAGDDDANKIYVLRAADHAKPLVTAYSGFVTPIERQIEDMTHERPVPEGFMDLLESIPASYLVVHTSNLANTRRDIESFLSTAVANDRLRFIRSYGNRDDLYAVTKIEPDAMQEGPIPFAVIPPVPKSVLEPDPSLRNAESSSNPIDDVRFFVRTQYKDLLDREPDRGGMAYWSGQIVNCGRDSRCIAEQRSRVSAAFFIEQEFQRTGFFLYRLYIETFGRAPAFAEFSADRRSMLNAEDGQARSKFVAAWTERPPFVRLYPPQMKPDEFVDALLNNIRQSSQVDLSALRERVIANLIKTKDRSQALVDLSGNEAFAQAEYNKAFVLMQYFGYLKRDADPAGYRFWLDVLNGASDNYRGMVRAFIMSREYRSRFIRQEEGAGKSGASPH